MKLQTPITLGQAADYLQCRMIGDPNMPITGLNEIHKVTEVICRLWITTNTTAKR